MRNWGSWEPKRDKRTAIVFAETTQERSILHNRSEILENRLRQTIPSSLTQDCIKVQKLHTELFTGLAPSLPDAVGTFRGTPGSSVENAERVVKVSGHVPGLREYDRCLSPHLVLSEMNAFENALQTLIQDPFTRNFLSDYCELCHRFFYIHPFIDGNGHVWRAVTIALARQFDIEVHSTWCIDPKPYGPDFSYALQVFLDAPQILNEWCHDHIFKFT